MGGEIKILKLQCYISSDPVNLCPGYSPSGQKEHLMQHGFHWQDR